MAYFAKTRPNLPHNISSTNSMLYSSGSGSDSDEVDTPLTERSLLFDDDDDDGIEIAAISSGSEEHIVSPIFPLIQFLGSLCLVSSSG